MILSVFASVQHLQRPFQVVQEVEGLVHRLPRLLPRRLAADLPRGLPLPLLALALPHLPQHLHQIQFPAPLGTFLVVDGPLAVAAEVPLLAEFEYL